MKKIEKVSAKNQKLFVIVHLLHIAIFVAVSWYAYKFWFPIMLWAYWGIFYMSVVWFMTLIFVIGIFHQIFSIVIALVSSEVLIDKTEKIIICRGKEFKFNEVICSGRRKFLGLRTQYFFVKIGKRKYYFSFLSPLESGFVSGPLFTGSNKHSRKLYQFFVEKLK